MAYDFQTFGPFLLERKKGLVSSDTLERFWAEVEDKREGLSSATGVYIVGTQRGGKPVKPWYVGKTDRGFKRRFHQHNRGVLFKTLGENAPSGPVAVFLMARVSGKTGSFRKGKKGRLGSIDGLELLLIGSCFAENPKLINAQKMSLYRHLMVPGYINDKKVKRHGAAKELAAMFEGKAS